MEQESQQHGPVAEEIVYITPIELKVIHQLYAASGEEGSETVSSDEENTSSHGVDEKMVGRRQTKKMHKGRSLSPDSTVVSCPPSKIKKEIRHFQSASLIERPGQNEVEVLFMTGQHHVQ